MEYLEYERKGKVAVITLNNPKQANALVQEIKEGLADIFTRIQFDPTVRSVMICSNGKHFSAGGDLSSMRSQSSCPDGRDRMRGASAWVKALYALEKPVVAAVQGCAYGAGFSLALASDFIVAEKGARFCCSFINVGLVPDLGSLYFLPRRIGLGKAKDLVYNGRVLTADEAERWGVADYVTDKEQLYDTAMELAEKLAERPTYAIGMMKKLTQFSYHTTLDAYLELENNMQAIAFQTEDHKQLVKQFFDKTPATLTGR